MASRLEGMMLNKTYDPKSFEAAWYKRWQDSGSFACDPRVLPILTRL